MVRELLFGNRTFGLLRGGLDAGADRMRVIAENIANVETPGYRAQRVAFESLLAQARDGGLDLARTHGAHLGGGASGSAPVPAPRRELTHAPVAPGAASNVDLERELVQMQKNEIQFQALSQVLADKYRGIRDAIRPSA